MRVITASRPESHHLDLWGHARLHHWDGAHVDRAEANASYAHSKNSKQQRIAATVNLVGRQLLVDRAPARSTVTHF
jgi:hypothetical protein